MGNFASNPHQSIANSYFFSSISQGYPAAYSNDAERRVRGREPPKECAAPRLAPAGQSGHSSNA